MHLRAVQAGFHVHQTQLGVNSAATVSQDLSASDDAPIFQQGIPNYTLSWHPINQAATNVPLQRHVLIDQMDVGLVCRDVEKELTPEPTYQSLVQVE